MITNLDVYKRDLAELIANGDRLLLTMEIEFQGEDFRNSLEKEYKDNKKAAEFLAKPPSFKNDYQAWYSESLVLLKQLLPARVSDFTKSYEKPNQRRKEITYENYVIEDALQGLRITRGGELVVGADAAIPIFKQQLNIVKHRFSSRVYAP